MPRKGNGVFHAPGFHASGARAECAARIFEKVTNGKTAALAAMLPLIIFAVVLFSSQTWNAPRFSDTDAAAETLARRIVDTMTDEEALAQVFMLGWVGAERSPLILDWIRLRNIGGVKIFGRDIAGTGRLAANTGELQRASLAGKYGIPLFVATDQEGGMVRHVKGDTSDTPGNMAIGASGFPRDAYLSGYYIGRELSLLGINMNFAPAVDLFTDRNSGLIGPRSFSDDPVSAGILGAAFARGQEAAGVMPTAKHFPGHGDTALDSHGTLPRINISFEELWERELVPYRILAREGIPAVMSGHLAFPAMPSGETPASLSPWFLENVLRERIGFRGLIITDDLMMNGATASAGSLSRAAKEALIAGNDILMFLQTPPLNDPVWTSLLSSMRTEPDFRVRVRGAAYRVLSAKLDWLRRENAPPFVPDPVRAAAELPAAEGAAFFQDLAARSVTVVRGGSIPLLPENAGNVLVAGQDPDFRNIGIEAYPGARPYYYALNKMGDGIADLRWNIRTYRIDTVIFCVSGAEGVTIARTLRGMEKKVIIFSVMNPVYAEEFTWADGVIAVYSDSRESLAAGFSVLTGSIPAQGRLPYRLQ